MRKYKVGQKFRQLAERPGTFVGMTVGDIWSYIGLSDMKGRHFLHNDAQPETMRRAYNGKLSFFDDELLQDFEPIEEPSDANA